MCHCNHLPNPDCKLADYNKDAQLFKCASVDMLILKYVTLLTILHFAQILAIFFTLCWQLKYFFYRASDPLEWLTHKKILFFPRFIVILDLLVLFMPFIIFISFLTLNLNFVVYGFFCQFRSGYY